MGLFTTNRPLSEFKEQLPNYLLFSKSNCLKKKTHVNQKRLLRNIGA